MHRGTSFEELWHDATRLAPERLAGRSLDWATRPPAHKSYPEAERIALPKPAAPAADLWACLQQRRSRRDYGTQALTREQLASLCWACQGVTGVHGPYHLRTAPSAGALYPFETYLSVQRVNDLPAALTHLHVPDFSLEVLSPGDHGPYLAQHALGQGFVAQAAAVFLWTAVVPRCTWKYRERAFRYLGLDLGHVCQNLALAAEALGLACCPVAAFLDAPMNQLLEVDGRDEFVYYLAAVGDEG